MQRKLILLIDDDPDDAYFFAEAIHEKQTQVKLQYVKSGEEAFQPLSNLNKLPALILLDAGMPKMNGWEFLRFIKKDSRYHMIPVVMIATSSRSKGIKEALEGGAESYIVKPSDFVNLKMIVENISSFSSGDIHTSLRIIRKNLPSSVFLTEN